MKTNKSQINEVGKDILDDATMTGSLIEDISYIRNKLLEDDNQVLRRVYVRTFFAAIEGAIFGMKKIALTIHERRAKGFSDYDLECLQKESIDLSKAQSALLTEAEAALLREMSYDLNDKGETFSQVKHIPLLKNIRFIFKITSRSFFIDYELKVDDDGWAALRDALEIRNRITHPKSLTDLDISDKELMRVSDAERWFAEHLHEIHLATIKGPFMKYLPNEDQEESS